MLRQLLSKFSKFTVFYFDENKKILQNNVLKRKRKRRSKRPENRRNFDLRWWECLIHYCQVPCRGGTGWKPGFRVYGIVKRERVLGSNPPPSHSNMVYDWKGGGCSDIQICHCCWFLNQHILTRYSLRSCPTKTFTKRLEMCDIDSLLFVSSVLNGKLLFSTGSTWVSVVHRCAGVRVRMRPAAAAPHNVYGRDWLAVITIIVPHTPASHLPALFLRRNHRY